MRESWLKLGCFLTGWNYAILRNCTEASKKKLKKYTSALIILLIIWFTVGYSFASTYVKGNFITSFSIAIVVCIIILQIERQIILSVGKNHIQVLFRFIIALVMGFLGSAIFDQILFKDDLEKRMIKVVDQQVREQLPYRLNVIDAKIVEAQKELDSLRTVTQQLHDDVEKRPTQTIISTSHTNIPDKDSLGNTIYRRQSSIDRQQIPNPKFKEIEANNINMHRLDSIKNVFTQHRMKEETNLRKELGSKKGFLEELDAMISILKESSTAFWFYILLFVFLFSLEMLVVFVKSDKYICDYEKIVEHQMAVKDKRINNLKSAGTIL